MNLDRWLAIGGVVVGLAGVLVAAIAWRRPTRGKLAAAIVSQRISDYPDIEIRHRGAVIPAPWTVTLVLRNVGPLDLTVDAFAGGYVRVSEEGANCKYIGVVSGEAALSTTGDGASICEIRPLMLQSGDERSVVILTDGQPTSVAEFMLANFMVNTREAPAFWERVRTAFRVSRFKSQGWAQ